MSTPSGLAIDVVFGTFGVPATYRPPRRGGADVACRVIRNSADRPLDGFAGKPMLRGETLEVRVSEVANAEAGGVFLIGTERLVIQGDPEIDDADRLVWTCTLG